MKVAATIGDPQFVAYASFTRGLGGLSVGLNPAQLTGPRRKSARLEETGSPEPFVNAYGRHDLLSHFFSAPFA